MKYLMLLLFLCALNSCQKVVCEVGNGFPETAIYNHTCCPITISNDQGNPLNTVAGNSSITYNGHHIIFAKNEQYTPDLNCERNAFHIY